MGRNIANCGSSVSFPYFPSSVTPCGRCRRLAAAFDGRRSVVPSIQIFEPFESLISSYFAGTVSGACGKQAAQVHACGRQHQSHKEFPDRRAKLIAEKTWTRQQTSRPPGRL
jgi:hypothetical protein